ncbi:Hypothetical protein GLP15_2887 [Giardia lamblia P15]|uniref:Uncharacterized protein n=1 Tax=Giardia intestinalis (strain P15) TaxID=658858 RepID=E1F8Z7_GIAIA|nr:Hypothetical protein GLP15_2887 [Giardia lamblia P15]
MVELTAAPVSDANSLPGPPTNQNPPFQNYNHGSGSGGRELLNRRGYRKPPQPLAQSASSLSPYLRGWPDRGSGPLVLFMVEGCHKGSPSHSIPPQERARGPTGRRLPVGLALQWRLHLDRSHVRSRLARDSCTSIRARADGSGFSYSTLAARVRQPSVRVPDHRRGHRPSCWHRGWRGLGRAGASVSYRAPRALHGSGGSPRSAQVVTCRSYLRRRDAAGSRRHLRLPAPGASHLQAVEGTARDLAVSPHCWARTEQQALLCHSLLFARSLSSTVTLGTLTHRLVAGPHISQRSPSLSCRLVVTALRLRAL